MCQKSFVDLTVILAVIVTIISSGKVLAQDNVDNMSIDQVKSKIQRLAESIENFQKREVWPGGNEYSGCYMWIHRQNFLKKGGAQRFVEEAKTDTVFIEGAKSLNYFSKKERFSLYEKWQKPVYPSWAMINEISNRGTTDAGYITQKEIAEALVELVKDMFLYPGKY